MNKWIRYRSVGYMRGRGLTFGVGPDPLLPDKAVAPGVYAIKVDVVPLPGVDVCDERLLVVADESLDWVAIGERLGMIYEPAVLLKAAERRLKVGGHLILALPIGRDDMQTRTRFTPNYARRMVEDCGSWVAKDAIERDGWLLQVYKKIGKRKGIWPGRIPHKPRACVIRYGAMGDLIMVTPLLRQLDEDGYEVTVNGTTYSMGVIENNPHVHNLIVQEKEAIPNPDLGEYWDEWAKEYDKYINLSESIEGKLLKVEGRREFYTHKAWRHAQCNKNYYDFTMELGGYPDVTGVRGELFLSKDEERTAQRIVKDLQSEFVVLWALNGTSKHKVYPMMEPMLREWLEHNPKAKVITVGDKLAQLLEFEHPQVLPMAGECSIRTSLALTKYVDLVVGPESVMINAAGCWDTPKIPLLSHSSHENLCKHFVNDYCLEPNVEKAPCYPCHQLHYTMEGCPRGLITIGDDDKEVTNGPLCAMGAIEPGRLMSRMDEVYANRNH